MAEAKQSAWNFSSDNVAPVAPAIMEAMVAANRGNVGSYGADGWTAALERRLQEVFESDLVAFPVATGTAANALALSVLVPPYGSVFCAEDAHINTDECGAPEFFAGGAKLLPLPAADGRITAGEIEAYAARVKKTGVHFPQPRAVSVTQSTEWGTVYGLDDLRAIGAAAAGLGLTLHMDGARFANALVRLGCSPAEMTWKAGVTALSFGATKNGAMAAEVVLFFDPSRAEGLAERRKRAAHLWSKHRFLSAQLLAYLENGLWLRNAAHANGEAARLAEGLIALPGVSLAQPVEANELFVIMPEGMVVALEAEGFAFYRWSEGPSAGQVVIRLVTSYATERAGVDAFIATAARFGNA